MEKQVNKFQLSVNHAFLLFVLLSLLLSVLVSSLLVGFTTDKSMREYHSNYAQTEAQLSARYVQQFLETRLQLLHDLASQPILINGVMGSDVSTASLADYLDSYQIVGIKEPIWLVNLANELVYSNQSNTLFELQAPWLEKLLMEELNIYQQHGFREALLNIMMKGGNSTVNGCVAGAVFGAMTGYQNLPSVCLQQISKSFISSLDKKVNLLLDLMGVP